MKQSRRQQDGFTLIEVLVALLIFSTATIALLTLSRDSAQTVRDLEDRYIARTISDSLMAETFVETVQLQLGDQTGLRTEMGRDFEWIRTIADSGQPGLNTVRIQVSRAEDQLLLAETVAIKRQDS